MDAILETAFNDQTGDWVPFSNWTLQTLTLKRATARYSSQNRGRRAHFYPFPLFFVLSSVLLWRLCSPLCLWRVETVDERQSIILGSFCAASVKLALVLSSVGHLGAPCAALSTASPNPQQAHNPLFCKWMLVMANQYWQIRNGI